MDPRSPPLIPEARAGFRRDRIEVRGSESPNSHVAEVFQKREAYLGSRRAD